MLKAFIGTVLALGIAWVMCTQFIHTVSLNVTIQRQAATIAALQASTANGIGHGSNDECSGH